MKRLCEYLDIICQDDVLEYVEKKHYDDSMNAVLSQGIEKLKKVTPSYNDNIIFLLYKEALYMQVSNQQSLTTKNQPQIFYSPLFFVEKLDITQQLTLNSLNQAQALGAYVVLDEDYSIPFMILSILDNIINHQDKIQDYINQMMNELTSKFPGANISTVSVIAQDGQIEENQIKEMESEIIEKQIHIDQAFEQKIKQYYQSILYS